MKIAFRSKSVRRGLLDYYGQLPSWVRLPSSRPIEPLKKDTSFTYTHSLSSISLLWYLICEFKCNESKRSVVFLLFGFYSSSTICRVHATILCSSICVQSKLHGFAVLQSRERNHANYRMVFNGLQIFVHFLSIFWVFQIPLDFYCPFFLLSSNVYFK